ncbi:type I restriction enzyme, S subunit [Pasteurella testudinis DSM 23072]|uniref:Type I restriction enzyme, S subunit n=1 Tax=Pasteurella testudinis DSM 23072 TaxID=1122938 RepID=A0A1W1V6K9_9PAST|nr:restriction endonuclease subunit S [Pasteurella testudinis]SMB89018.1 type I restriction enzyme, S subunit [Pasteurella testudinis DSM 23072]SUB50224.1 EcoKI restriction-modification system protein HsdS [Pasteurella testudinis]
MNQLPNGWKQINLKNIIDGSIKNGFSPVAASHETGYWVLSLGALTDDGIQVSEIKPVLPESKILENILSMNDFLVSRSNTPSKVGRSIRFQNEINNCAYPDLMMRFRINSEKADVAYIEQFLRSSFVRSYFTNSAAGSSKTMVKINKRILENTLIYLPENINEQTKIAQILTTWDNAIRTIEQLIQNSEQQKQALMQQLLTGKKRLFDENGERFCGVWETKKLSTLIQEINKEKEIFPDVIELLTVKLHHKGAVRSGKFPKTTEKGRPYYKRYAGELIIGRQNLHNGGVAIVPDECNGLIASSAISSFNAKGDNTDLEFILSVMSTEYFKFMVNNLTGGTGQKEVSVSQLMSISIPVPPFKEQQKIAAVLTAADNEIDTLKQTLCRLKTEKQALMQQLLTGKRRVFVALSEQE